MIRLLITKTFAVLAIALLAVSCSSTDSGSANEQSAASVPGEKVQGDNQVMPNTTGGVPGASVGW